MKRMFIISLNFDWVAMIILKLIMTGIPKKVQSENGFKLKLDIPTSTNDVIDAFVIAIPSASSTCKERI